MRISSRWLIAGILYMFSCLHIQGAEKKAIQDSELEALWQTRSDNYVLAIQECKRLLATLESSSSSKERIELLLLKSVFENKALRPLEASLSLIDAEKRIKEELKDSSLLAAVFYAKSLVALAVSQDKEAIANNYSGLEAFDSYGGRRIIQVKLHNNLSTLLKDKSEMLYHAKKALALSVSHSIFDQQISALINLGYIFAIHEEYDSARYYFQEALPVARKSNSYREVGKLYNNLAGLSESEKEQELYIDSAIVYADLSGRLFDLQRYMENKSLFLYDSESYEEAFDFLWESSQLKDTLMELKSVEAVVEMQEKYDAEKKSNEIKQLTVEKLAQEVENLNFQKNQSRLLIGGGIVVFIAIFMGISFVQLRKNRNQLAAKNIELDIARKASDSLLLNILPEMIAEELKLKGEAEAQGYERASILFTDFKGFTSTAEKLNAVDLVAEINSCFKAFDDITEKYKIEKIKTIGDAYMAVGGVPVPKPDSVVDTIMAALEMQSFIKKRKQENEAFGKPAFDMRVGIHTGPVVAGIVGVKKFQYDIWGDAVNIASRMESSGEVGRVNISESCFSALKDHPEFSFEYRGLIEAKGKGELKMWFVSQSS